MKLVMNRDIRRTLLQRMSSVLASRCKCKFYEKGERIVLNNTLVTFRKFHERARWNLMMNRNVSETRCSLQLLNSERRS